MAKLLALDVGLARIGVAITDVDQKLAFPHSTVKVYAFEQAVYDVLDIIEDEQIEKVFVGLPISDDGTESSVAPKIRQFVKLLQVETDVGIEFVDERYTTKMAHQQLKDLGKSPSRSRNIVDQIAAVNILTGDQILPLEVV
ncbi:hypothetical protein FACS1894125_6240 [Actinomycetota bacterium]|nr:hypothetical protein FACS1894125_6240 [Actinomycetota bacterium]